MMNEPGRLDGELYRLEQFTDTPSPALVVYEELVKNNLAIIRSELETLSPRVGMGHLRPHVKTHKSAWAIRLQLSAGIEKFKCSHNELDLLLDEGPLPKESVTNFGASPIRRPVRGLISRLWESIALSLRQYRSLCSSASRW